MKDSEIVGLAKKPATETSKVKKKQELVVYSCTHDRSVFPTEHPRREKPQKGQT